MIKIVLVNAKMFRFFPFLSILAVTVIFAGLMNCSDSGPDWNERCREAIEGGTYEEILDNCSYLGYAELSSSQRFTVGIMALQENDPDNARIYFEDIESTAGEYGSAQYGIMLAELQKIMRMLNVLLQFYIEYPSTVFGFLQEIRPQAEEPDMFFPAQASDYLSIEVIRDLQERAFTAVQNGYSIEVEEYPVFIGSESDRVYLRYLFTGKQGELGALLYWLFSDVFIAASNYASAHNTSLDLGGLLNDLDLLLDNAWDPGGGGLFGLIRGAGRVLVNNPDFLEKRSDVWDTYMEEVKGNSILGKGGELIQQVGRIIEERAETDPEHCEEVICLIDRDENGIISEGDQLRVNGNIHGELGSDFLVGEGAVLSQGLIEDFDSLNDTYGEMGIHIAAAPPGVTVFVDMTAADYLESTERRVSFLAGFFAPMESFLDSVMESTGSESKYVTIPELNRVLATLGFPELPNVVRFNVHRFLDMPIRDLLVYHCEEDNMAVECGISPDPVLAVEIELVNVEEQCETGTISCGPEPYPYYLKEGDRDHFVGTDDEIPADGLSPVEQDPDSLAPTNALIYISIGDPSMNGAMELDLNALPEACGPEGTAGFEPATNYGLNKVMNCLILDYLPRVEEAETVENIILLADPFFEIVGWTWER